MTIEESKLRVSVIYWVSFMTDGRLQQVKLTWNNLKMELKQNFNSKSYLIVHIHIVYQSLSDQHDQYALTYRCVWFMRSSRKRCRLDSIILITEASWPLWWCNDYGWKIMGSIPVRDKPKNIKFVFAKHTRLRIKNKNLFVWNQDNVSNGASFESLDIFQRCIKKRKTNSVDKTSIKQALSSLSH
jgi:hypothetical protein